MKAHRIAVHRLITSDSDSIDVNHAIWIIIIINIVKFNCIFNLLKF